MFKIVLVSFFAMSAVMAADDGKYRPERYGGDDGRYRPEIYGDDGRYYGNSSPYVKYVVSSIAVKPVISTPQTNVFGTTVFQPIVQNPFGSNRYVAEVVPAAIVPQRLIVKPYASNPEATSRILKQEDEHSATGYRYSYDTENNIRAEESGYLQNINTNQEGLKATGFYEYIGPDNIKYRVDYIADENGFQPVGDHLPKPHPNIAKYLATLN